MNTTAKRLAILMAKDEKVFHINDLANYWLIKNKNTLRTTLKRYTQNGIIYRIYRGFYSILPVSEIPPILLGSKAIHSPCYLSTESVLFQQGYIAQNPYYCTFVSEKSQKFSIKDYNYLSRQLKSKFLSNPEGTFIKDNVIFATPERAIADLLYFNPKYHFDRPIDWRKIKKLQQIIGYPLTENRYDFTKTK